MWEELLFVLRLLSSRKDKDVGVVSNIYWHKLCVCMCMCVYMRVHFSQQPATNNII